MQITYLTRLSTSPVARSTWAPWLDRGSNKRRLVQDFRLVVDGVAYCVPRGYVTDGASIPRLLWWAFPPSYSEAQRAAVFHDYCYSHLYRRVSKAFADRAFRQMMLKDGARPAVAAMFYRAVKWFGRGGW